MKEGWEKRVKEMDQLDKEEKKTRGKRAFMGWLKKLCAKLEVQKAEESKKRMEAKLKEEKK